MHLKVSLPTKVFCRTHRKYKYWWITAFFNVTNVWHKVMSVTPEAPRHPSQLSAFPAVLLHKLRLFYSLTLMPFYIFFPSTLFSSLPSVAGLHFLFSLHLSYTNAFLRFISNFAGHPHSTSHKHVVWSSYSRRYTIPYLTFYLSTNL